MTVARSCSTVRVRVRLTFEYDVVRAGETEAPAEATTAHAAVDATGPEELRRRLQ
jgi:acyl-CoA thioesterase FadM